MKKIDIQWLGHSCFKLTWGDWSAVLDPYADGSVPGLKDLQVSAIDVFCSHSHNDHGADYKVKQQKMFAPAPKITNVNSFHDDKHGTKRGENIINVFDFDGVKVAHFGDLGHILEPEQLRLIGDVDVALIPVGGFYTVDAINAQKVAQQVNAKIIVPMHFSTDKFGFDVINSVGEFTKLYDDVIYTDDDTLSDINAMLYSIKNCEMPRVIVLAPAMIK